VHRCRVRAESSELRLKTYDLSWFLIDKIDKTLPAAFRIDEFNIDDLTHCAVIEELSIVSVEMVSYSELIVIKLDVFWIYMHGILKSFENKASWFVESAADDDGIETFIVDTKERTVGGRGGMIETRKLW
jgi:hypothetical protein